MGELFSERSDASVSMFVGPATKWENHTWLRVEHACAGVASAKYSRQRYSWHSCQYPRGWVSFSLSSSDSCESLAMNHTDKFYLRSENFIIVARNNSTRYPYVLTFLTMQRDILSGRNNGFMEKCCWTHLNANMSTFFNCADCNCLLPLHVFFLLSTSANFAKLPFPVFFFLFEAKVTS